MTQKSAILLAAGLLTLAGCNARTPAEPRAAPGLWALTTTSTSMKTYPPRTLPARGQLICVESSGKIALPYYRARAGADCQTDHHGKKQGGGWTSETVCHNPDFGEMTITARVTGDLVRTFQIKGHVKSSTADISAMVTGAYKGPCPQPAATPREPDPPADRP